MSTEKPNPAQDGADDAEALTWYGEEDVVLAPEPAAQDPVVSAEEASAQDAALAEAGPGTYGPIAAEPSEDEAPSREQLPAPMLVALGVFAGIFLLYTIAWGILAAQSWGVSADALIVAVYRVQLVGIVAVPSLWFASTLAVTRGRPHLNRVLGLLIGALLFIPWPAVLTTGVSA